MLQQLSRNANVIYHLISNGSAFATRVGGYGDARKRTTIHDCDDLATEMATKLPERTIELIAPDDDCDTD